MPIFSLTVKTVWVLVPLPSTATTLWEVDTKHEQANGNTQTQFMLPLSAFLMKMTFDWFHSSSFRRFPHMWVEELSSNQDEITSCSGALWGFCCFQLGQKVTQLGGVLAHSPKPHTSGIHRQPFMSNPSFCKRQKEKGFSSPAVAVIQLPVIYPVTS